MIHNEALHFFGIGSLTSLKLNLYVRTASQKNSSHASKIFSSWKSPNKSYKVFTIIFTFYFFKTSYSCIILLQFSITTNNTKLVNANYEPKSLISTPYIFDEKKWMNNQSYSSTSIPHVSNQSSSVTYNFSSFYR
jgi:hypothetical protein